MMPPRFAIVGHPNKGKSSIVATLAEDDTVAISPEPGTTVTTGAYPLRVDGEVLYELFDTPGFQRARETLAWLDAHDRGAGAREETVREFVRTHKDDPRFRDECELLGPLLDGAGILYVVDGSRPYGRQYEAEMEILRRTGRPRMALINLIGSGDHLEEWRAALSQYFSIVRIFDAVEADFSKRVELLRSFGAIDERWAESLNRAADTLVLERGRRHRRAAREITELLAAVLTATETVSLPDPAKQEEAELRARRKLRDTVRALERRERRSVEEIYGHAGIEIEELQEASLAEDIFSRRSFSVFGLSTAQLAMTGAASGAVAGGLVDVAAGGASLLLGAAIGAAVGAVSTLAGARRLAKAEVFGQPLGGYELRVGPLSDPNLPWVLMSRAVLHARLVAERNHARRGKLILETVGTEQLGAELGSADRRKIDGLLRALRQGGDEAARAALTDVIFAMLESDVEAAAE
jgi:Domain of unknown function (DUF3482)/50S ribosome-binding GTPase